MNNIALKFLSGNVHFCLHDKSSLRLQKKVIKGELPPDIIYNLFVFQSPVATIDNPSGHHQCNYANRKYHTTTNKGQLYMSFTLRSNKPDND